MVSIYPRLGVCDVDYGGICDFECFVFLTINTSSRFLEWLYHLASLDRYFYRLSSRLLSIPEYQYGTFFAVIGPFRQWLRPFTCIGFVQWSSGSKSFTEKSMGSIDFGGGRHVFTSEHTRSSITLRRRLSGPLCTKPSALSTDRRISKAWKFLNTQVIPYSNLG